MDNLWTNVVAKRLKTYCRCQSWGKTNPGASSSNHPVLKALPPIEIRTIENESFGTSPHKDEDVLFWEKMPQRRDPHQGCYLQH
eukprot:1140153-Pelagomonas_calceolata.AAC.1